MLFVGLLFFEIDQTTEATPIGFICIFCYRQFNVLNAFPVTNEWLTTAVQDLPLTFFASSFQTLLALVYPSIL